MENKDINSWLDGIENIWHISSTLASQNAPAKFKKDTLSDEDVTKLIGDIAANSKAERIFWFLELLDEKYEQERRNKELKFEKLNLHNYIGSMLDKIGSERYVSYIAELIKKIANYDLKDHVKKILSKIADNQSASDMKKIVDSLKMCEKVKQNFSQYIELILEKLKNNQSGYDLDDMAKLIKEFKDCGLEKKHVEKIFGKIAANQKSSHMKKIAQSLKNCKIIGINLGDCIEPILDKLNKNQSARSITSLIKSLTDNKFKLQDAQVKLILNKLDQEAITNDVLDFIEELKTNNKNITLDSNVYAAIFGSLEKKLSTDDVLNFINELKEKDKDIKWDSNIYAAIFGSLEKKLSTDDVLDFITNLKNNHKDIEWNSNVYAAIFGSLKQNLSRDQLLDFINELKENHNDIKLDSNVCAAIFGSLENQLSTNDVSEFIKELKENHKDIALNSNVYAAIFESLSLTRFSSISPSIHLLVNTGTKSNNRCVKIILNKIPDGFSLDNLNNLIKILTRYDVELNDKRVEIILGSVHIKEI